MYLKQCAVSLRCAYGGQFDPHEAVSVPVSLTRTGFPRIIPRHHRYLIHVGDDRADALVRLYLSLFSFYSLIEIGKRLSQETFKTIKTPVGNIDSVVEFVNEVKASFPTLIRRYVPDIQTIPLSQGMRWIPSWKALPSYMAFRYVYSNVFKEKSKFSKVKSPFLVQTFELAAFRHLVEFINARGEQWSQGILWPKRTRYAFDTMNKVFSGIDLELFEAQVGPYLPPWHPACGPVITGKLGQKVEGGGKRRIFAIGNWVNQRLLSPVHDWLASVLRRLKTDGTFDQPRPLGYLKGSMDCFSFDLNHR